MLNVRKESPLLIVVFVLLFIIAAVHLVGILKGLYWRLWWYDIPLHLAGGAWVGILFFYLFGERLRIFSHSYFLENILFTFIVALSFVVAIGMLWEFYEYLYDVFIASRHPVRAAQQGPLDTLADIFNDILGGFVSVSVLLYSLKQRTERFLFAEQKQ